MNSKDIEELATASVKKSILLTGLLDQYISENDKEPFWDGNIYIYENEKKRKEDFIGRVPVQIKGKESKIIDDNSIKYSVKITDLKGYIKVSGLVYFVVLVSNIGKEKIYYNALTPIKLKQLLENTKNRNMITLKFNSFPTDNRDKINIIRDIYTHSQKQISFVNSEIPSLTDLEKQSNPIEIVQTMSAYGYSDSKSDLFTSLLEKETYMYARNGGVLLPLSDIGVVSSIEEEACEVVKVRDKVYYSSFTRKYIKDKILVKIGRSLELIIEQPSNRLLIRIKGAPMLSDRIKDLEFLIDAIENEEFSINEKILDIRPENLGREKINCTKIKESFKCCCKVKELFENLHIENDLNLSKLTEREIKNLFYLISAFVDGQTIKFKNTNDSKYLYYKVQDITILIYACEEVAGSYEYRYLNIFDGISSIPSADGNDVLYPIHSMLRSEHYINISNIRYDLMLDHYKFFAKANKDIYVQANLDVLQILLAYDTCNKQILLNTALEIMEWVLQNSEEKDDNKVIYKINFFQVITRLRKLTDEEENILLGIAIGEKTVDEIKFAANVLLKEAQYAKLYFEKLNLNLVSQIKEYPIYNLYRKLIL